MKTTTRVGLLFGMALGLVCFCTTAQEAVFFRIVSTQQTYIVSLDSAGLLVWSNAIPGTPCQVQAKRGINGVWTNGFPTSPAQTNGSLLQLRVPMCRVLDRWIVAFQPEVTLTQAEALFDANGIIWAPLAWDWLRMATVCVPQGKSLSAIKESPLVRYVEWDATVQIF